MTSKSKKGECLSNCTVIALTVVIVLMVELCAFISPTKLQVSVDHSLMYPALQPEMTVWPPGRKHRPHIQSLWALLRDLTT